MPEKLPGDLLLTGAVRVYPVRLKRDPVPPFPRIQHKRARARERLSDEGRIDVIEARRKPDNHDEAPLLIYTHL